MEKLVPDGGTKSQKIIYWIVTGIVLAFDSGCALIFFNSDLAKEGTRHLGFPDYFRIELTVGKIIGGIVLLVPLFPARVKEWAYAGFGIATISAIIADTVIDGPKGAVFPTIVLIFFIISYIYYHKINKH